MVFSKYASARFNEHCTSFAGVLAGSLGVDMLQDRSAQKYQPKPTLGILRAGEKWWYLKYRSTSCMGPARKREGDEGATVQPRAEERPAATSTSVWGGKWWWLLLLGGLSPSALPFLSISKNNLWFHTSPTSFSRSPVLRRRAAVLWPLAGCWLLLAEEQYWWQVASKTSTMVHSSSSSRICKRNPRREWE